MKLTNEERNTAIQALNIAAAMFESDAKDAGVPRVTEQFLRQQDDALALADKLEGADDEITW